MQSTNLVKRTGALPLALGTISFAVCFAAWGLIAAFAPRFRDTFHLSATQAAFVVAVPVLLGSLARLPVGMLADRFGGRLVFSVADAVVRRSCISDADGRIPMSNCCWADSFWDWPGHPLPWVSDSSRDGSARNNKGSALGVYGLGNIGQSAAVFLGPLLAVSLGWQNIFRGMAVILVVWAVVFWMFARNAPVTYSRKTIGEMVELACAMSAFPGHCPHSIS